MEPITAPVRYLIAEQDGVPRGPDPWCEFGWHPADKVSADDACGIEMCAECATLPEHISFDAEIVADMTKPHDPNDPLSVVYPLARGEESK